MPNERAFLVTVQLDPRFSKGGAMWALDDEARELRELTESSGCRVVGEIQAKRHQPMAGTFLGRGKLEEIAHAAASLQSQVVIVNHELSPAQQRNIEEMLDVKTIDRTQLILDIFAQHAKSQEGKVQVELAQLRYLLPRLSGKGITLSRLGGGIGTRGPGEQKLEMDRRRIRSKIARLNDDLEGLQRRREATRSRRKDTEVPVVALVGYTNAGKTTLLNRLTGAMGHVQNQLFTTLDPLARRLSLPAGQTVIVTDTVGFLHQLPHHLIEAFHATLEEARDAHLLLHVLDVTHALVTQHVKAVEEVLAKLALREKPTVTVLNKCDLLNDRQRVASLERTYHPACAISAKTGEGIERLRSLLAQQLGLLMIPPLLANPKGPVRCVEPPSAAAKSGEMIEPVVLRVPAEQTQLIASLYQAGQVLQRQEIDGII